jgi:chromosome segregation ATPase
MCKKIGFATFAVVLGLALLGFTKHGRWLFSHGQLAFHKAGIGVSDQVPLDWEIDRINQEIDNLTLDVKKNFSIVASEEVAIERTRREVSTIKANLENRKDGILLMKAKLETGATTVSIAGKEFTAARVHEKLSQDWEAYKSAEAALKAKEKLVEQKEVLVENANAKIVAMKAQQDKLRTEVARMKAELEEARLAQTQSEVQIDDSRLAGIKASMADVQDQISRMKKEAELQGHFTTRQINVEDAVQSVNALNEIEQRFGGKKVAADK